MQTLLLTGFEPFGGDGRNPSGELAAALDGHVLTNGTAVRSLVLPVAAERAWQLVVPAVRRLRPRWIVATGVAPRGAITPERQAVNRCDYRIPDNDGAAPRGARAVASRRRSWTTGCDVEALAAAVAAADVPADVSGDAGLFVCNALYCRLLRLTSRRGHCAEGRGLFVHVPKIPEMGGEGPWLEAERIRCGLLALLERLVG